MPFKAKIKEDFIIENNIIKLTDKYLKNNKQKFKKITGSRLASILNKNKYVSPVKIWCMMTNLYFEEMDPILSNVGQVIEPKIKQHVENITKINYLSYDPFKVKWDIFSDNDIFGGIPDGEPSVNGKVDYSKNEPMLEIKTTSIDSFVYKTVDGVLKLQLDNKNVPLVKKVNGKKESWYENGVINIPIEYKLQLCLYLYLRNVTKGMFAIAFLEKEDYANPQEFNPENRHIELVEINLTLEKFDKVIEASKNWYNKYIKNGESPPLSVEDIKWLKENQIIL